MSVSAPARAMRPETRDMYVAAVQLRCDGMRYEEIGRELQVSSTTIANALRTMRSIYGAHTEAQLVMMMIEAGEILVRR